MVIDGHAHACGRFLTPKGIIKELDKNRVDKVVLVPGELNSTAEYALPNIAAKFPNSNVVKVTNGLTRFMMRITGKVKDIPAGNEFVYQLKSEANDRIIQIVWVTTRIKNVTKYLDEKYEVWAFGGLKLHQCWESFSIDSVYFKEVAIWAEKHQLPLFIHLFRDEDVKQIIEYKRKHPGLKLIIAHLFGLEIFMEGKINDKNLYFDISPLPLISNQRLFKSIDYVGAERILFGTDTPYGAKNNLAKSIERIKTLELSEGDKDLILGKNMKRLLDLK
jgi:predicted TIM-barrel fold metal-dependent hydrolase